MEPKIIIIGAGVAGIAAATKLLKTGFKNVTILEAEQRIGGRICSVKVDDSFIDLGAQWVHGQKENTVYKMVEDLDLLSLSFNQYNDFTFYVTNGTIDKEISDCLVEIGHKIIKDENGCGQYYTGTFGEYFNTKFNENISKEFMDNRNVLMLSKLILTWFGKLVSSLDAAESWFDVSTNGFFAYEECEGNQYFNWKNKGYQEFLNVLKENVTLKDHLLLKKKVKHIKWDNPTKESPITVFCSDDTLHKADQVIVTVSLGVLKKHHSEMFTPALPLTKINSIESSYFGTVNKIFLKFPEKWWQEDCKGFSLLYTEEDRNCFVSEFPYGPWFDGRSWLEDIYGFYVVDDHSKILLGWVVGKAATKIEYLTDDVVKNGCMYLLHKFLNDKYNIPEPDDIIRSKWHSNSNFYGSYSYIGKKAEQGKAEVTEELAKPLYSEKYNEVIPRLLFAGEATHQSKYSTVHGACDTGFREAQRLIDFYTNITEHFKVIIVGAGFAGLGAALKLTELNFKSFVVLEASDVPGGRIRSLNIDGTPLDVGAQWLHGHDNPLYRICIENNLLAEEKSEEGLGIYIRDDGLVFNEYLVKQVDFQIGKILEECQSYINKTTFPESVEHFMREKFAEYIQTDSDDLKTLKMQLLNWHLRFQVVDNSCFDMKCLSAKSWGCYVCQDDTAHYNLKSGYGSLVDVLVKKLPDNCLRFNSILNDVNYNEHSGRLEITFNGNQKLACDHLILTASLGILKISPNLIYGCSELLRKSINGMGFYGIGKIYLFFAEKWWGDWKGIQLVWRQTTVLPEGLEWMKHLTGFEEVFNHPKALLGWIGSSGVEKMEKLSEKKVGAACVSILKRFLPDFNVPNPIRVIRTQWLSDPWVKGSYCHITPDCDNFESVIRKLAEPVTMDGIPKIYLAGEAMHETHYSTTHGAYESGQDQAEKLFNFLKKTNSVNMKNQ